MQGGQHHEDTDIMECDFGRWVGWQGAKKWGLGRSAKEKYAPVEPVSKLLASLSNCRGVDNGSELLHVLAEE
jgi:hypothetical protein